MPKVTGIFDLFKDLDIIPVNDVANWLKHPPDPLILGNFMANRLLYPQTIGVSQEEMDWDLAFLREALKRKPQFRDLEARKIIIPEAFVLRTPDLSKLIWVFIDAYILGWSAKNPGQNVWTLIIRSDDRDEVIGSVILPEFAMDTSHMEVRLNEKNIKIPKGGLTVIPCNLNHCVLTFKINGGNMLGVETGKVEVLGGRLGIVVDGRR